MMLAHPGRYWNLDNGSVPAETLEKYVTLYTEFRKNSWSDLRCLMHTIFIPGTDIWDALLAR